MFKPIILCFLLFFFSNCGKKAPEKSYLPKMEFKRTPNPKYNHYFPDENISEIKPKNEVTNKTISKEPIPSFQKTAEKIDDDKDSPGFFSFLFTKKNKINNEKQNICEELLDINKNILIEQNNKLVALNNNNLDLKNQIADMNKQIKKLNTTKSSNNRTLEKEIDRLNKLIKILSTEIK